MTFFLLFVDLGQRNTRICNENGINLTTEIISLKLTTENDSLKLTTENNSLKLITENNRINNRK